MFGKLISSSFFLVIWIVQVQSWKNRVTTGNWDNSYIKLGKKQSQSNSWEDVLLYNFTRRRSIIIFFRCGQRKRPVQALFHQRARVIMGAWQTGRKWSTGRSRRKSSMTRGRTLPLWKKGPALTQTHSAPFESSLLAHILQMLLGSKINSHISSNFWPDHQDGRLVI